MCYWNDRTDYWIVECRETLDIAPQRVLFVKGQRVVLSDRMQAETFRFRSGSWQWTCWRWRVPQYLQSGKQLLDVTCMYGHTTPLFQATPVSGLGLCTKKAKRRRNLPSRHAHYMDRDTRRFARRAKFWLFAKQWKYTTGIIAFSLFSTCASATIDSSRRSPT